MVGSCQTVLQFSSTAFVITNKVRTRVNISLRAGRGASEEGSDFQGDTAKSLLLSHHRLVMFKHSSADGTHTPPTAQWGGCAPDRVPDTALPTRHFSQNWAKLHWTSLPKCGACATKHKQAHPLTDDSRERSLKSAKGTAGTSWTGREQTWLQAIFYIFLILSHVLFWDSRLLLSRSWCSQCLQMA